MAISTRRLVLLRCAAVEAEVVVEEDFGSTKATWSFFSRRGGEGETDIETEDPRRRRAGDDDELWLIATLTPSLT